MDVYGDSHSGTDDHTSLITWTMAAKATAQIQYGITVLGTDNAQSIQDTTDGCGKLLQINQNTGRAMSHFDVHFYSLEVAKLSEGE